MKRFLLEIIRHDWEKSRKVAFDFSSADLSNLGRLQAKPIFTLRAKGKNLSSGEVARMLSEFDFFDVNKNKKGRGIFHLYETLVREGEMIVIDHATGLTWQQSGSSNYMNYARAEEYIRNLKNTVFAGYNDWRLPTLEEAMSLMEPKKHGDLYIAAVFDREQTWIWTADKESAGRAWSVHFSYGYCYYDPVDLNDVYVRAVRRGQSII